MKTKFISLALCSMLLLMTSCATIFSGTKQNVSFQSTPPDATVSVVMKKGSPMVIGKTPCTVQISKKARNILFEKDGYYHETYNIRSQVGVNAWYWIDLVGCLVLVGAIPTIIDASTGSYYKLPSEVKVELKKK